jgi:TonB family protein
VIEKLVEPVYPEQAVRNNIEGRVQIQALVDTTGRVVEVQLFASTGEELLERAAEAAVWQCRFRPYLHQGATRPVYALFRFNFRIY